MFVYAKTSIYTDDIHCNYPRRDGQAELVSVADYLQNGLPAHKRLPTVFNVRQSYCSRYMLDVRPSVRPSVCLSVCLVLCRNEST